MNKLKTGDEVIIISGKDKGKTGTLTKFLAKDRCIVMGLKIVKKHQKPNPQLNIAGGIIEKESPIHISNVAIYNKKLKSKNTRYDLSIVLPSNFLNIQNLILNFILKPLLI